MVDITTFQLIWFVLLSVLMIGYFVLDGFDLGVGILYPFLSKDEKERAAMRLSIGPVWDGNEVWLLTLEARCSRRSRRRTPRCSRGSISRSWSSSLP